MIDREADLKAVAELALEQEDCSVVKVALAIREHLGHRDALTTINDAQFALSLVGTTRAISLIQTYRRNHAANVAAMSRNY